MTNFAYNWGFPLDRLFTNVARLAIQWEYHKSGRFRSPYMEVISMNMTMTHSNKACDVQNPNKRTCIQVLEQVENRNSFDSL